MEETALDVKKHINGLSTVIEEKKLEDDPDSEKPRDSMEFQDQIEPQDAN